MKLFILICCLTIIIIFIVNYFWGNKISIQWEQNPSLPKGTAGHVMDFCGDAITIAGGTFWQDDIKIWDNEIIAFDPESDRWNIVSYLPEPAGYAVSASVDNSFYILGGINDKTYQDKCYKITKKSDIYTISEITPMPQPRAYAGVSSDENNIYIIGGKNDNEKDNYFYPTFTYSIKDNSWSELAPIPDNNRIQSAAIKCNKTIYLFGGYYNGKNTDEAFSFFNSKWTKIKKMPFPVRGQAIAVYKDRFIFLFGGYTDQGFTNTVTIYDTVKNNYFKTTPLPYSIMGAKAVITNNLILLSGGEDMPKHRSDFFYRGIIKNR